jgi:hypothetical protein
MVPKEDAAEQKGPMQERPVGVEDPRERRHHSRHRRQNDQGVAEAWRREVAVER